MILSQLKSSLSSEWFYLNIEIRKQGASNNGIKLFILYTMLEKGGKVEKDKKQIIEICFYHLSKKD